MLPSLQLNSSLRSIPMQLLLAHVVAGKQYFLPTFQNSNLASVKSTEYCPAGGGRVFVGGFALIKKLSSIDLWKLLARPEVSTPLHSATPLALCLPPHTSFHSFLLISLKIFPLMLFHQKRDYKLHSTWPVGKFKPACSSIYFQSAQ